MKIHNIAQGTAEWQALRAGRFHGQRGARDDGRQPSTRRARRALRRKATGIAPEVDPATAPLLDAGHQAEATRGRGHDRRRAFPGHDHRRWDGAWPLASMDGLTMLGDIGWENKLYNAATAAQIEQTGEPPLHHVWQLEQQLLVSGASESCSPAATAPSAACALLVRIRLERRAALIAGWKQFAADLAVTCARGAAPRRPAARRSRCPPCASRRSRAPSLPPTWLTSRRTPWPCSALSTATCARGPGLSRRRRAHRPRVRRREARLKAAKAPRWHTDRRHRSAVPRDRRHRRRGPPDPAGAAR